MRRISIDPITRLEGHGKIEIFLDDEGEPLADDFELPFTDPVAGYPADAVHAGGDAFFVSWSQGDSPDLTLRGAFVRP